MIHLSTFLLALFLSMGLVPLLARSAQWLHAVDQPDGRKVHTRPTPRTGGIALAVGATVPLLLWGPFSTRLTAILAGTGIIVACGFLDDVCDLGYGVKFLGQAAAALVVIFYGGLRIESLGDLLPFGRSLPTAAALALTVTVIVGVTNAINLADGLDGLAGGISVLIFGAIGYLAYAGDDPELALLAAALGGALFGFLRFNSHPAVVFMGDAGSQLLGFTAITAALTLTQGDTTAYSPLLPVLLLGFPVLDTVTVMAERLAEGRSPFVADKKHFHHRLLRLGLYHADAVRLIYLVQAGLVAAALLLRFESEWLLAGGYVLFCTATLSSFALADRYGWRIKPYEGLKNRLRVARESGLGIRVCFRLTQAAVPGLLLLSCLLVDDVSQTNALLAAGVAGLIVGGWVFGRRFSRTALRLGTYLAVPLVVYLSDGFRAAVPAVGLLYNASFGAVVLLTVLVVKLSRRQAFRSTPLDLLMVLAALVLPAASWGHLSPGMVAAKVIALFFGYEVLLTEQREKVSWVSGTTVAALGIIAGKGIV